MAGDGIFGPLRGVRHRIGSPADEPTAATGCSIVFCRGVALVDDINTHLPHLLPMAGLRLVIHRLHHPLRPILVQYPLAIIASSLLRPNNTIQH